jgi:uncharacterized membrane protein YhhN
MLSIIFLIILAVVAFFNIAGNLKERRKIVVISKPLLVPCIIGFYITSTTSLNVLIVIALLFGLGGDVFLLWKKTSPKAVLLGLLSFMIGHVFYIIAFGLSTGCFSTWQWWFAILVLPYVLYAFCLYRLLSASLESMKVPAVVYMIVLLTMSFFALALMAVLSGFTGLVFVGSILFVVSDSVLAVEQFKKHDEIFHHSIVMATYIVAQLLIATGFIA